MEQGSGRPILQDRDSSRSSLFQPGSALVVVGRLKGEILSRFGKGLFQMFLTWRLGGQWVRFQFLQFSSGSGSLGIGVFRFFLKTRSSGGFSLFKGLSFIIKRRSFTTHAEIWLHKGLWFLNSKQLALHQKRSEDWNCSARWLRSLMLPDSFCCLS